MNNKKTERVSFMLYTRHCFILLVLISVISVLVACGSGGGGGGSGELTGNTPENNTGPDSGNGGPSIITTDPELSSGVALFEEVQKNFNLYESPDIKLTAPDIAENGWVVPFDIIIPKDPGTIWVFVDSNADKVVLKADFLNYDSIGTFLGSRIRMIETGSIYAVFIDINGVISATRKKLKITIGNAPELCNPDIYSCNESLLTDLRMRASNGKVKMLIDSPMFVDNYVRRVSILSNSASVAEIYLSPNISKNPYLVILYVIGSTSLVNVTLYDLENRSTSQEIIPTN